MASSFTPDSDAIPIPPLSVAILSQRDLEVQIPIDKVVEPGISLKAACFSNNTYESAAAKKCLSNLLAVGYRRLALDVFWDPSGRTWSLCPGLSNQANCSGSLALDLVSSVLGDYLKSTSTNLGARTTIVTLAVHATAPANGTSAVLDSANLPNGDQELSDVLQGLAGDIYTPATLRMQRENLNSTWLGSPESPTPDLAYLSTSLNSQGNLMTLTGWPNVGLTTFQKRLLIGLGPIDDAMRNYNITNDLLAYHNTSSVTNSQSVEFGSSGISRGCLFDSTSTDLALSTQWAIASNTTLASDQSLQPINPTVSNLTFCGISPFINPITTSSAPIPIESHLGVIRSQIWSWAANEPRNLSTSENSNDKYRCALQDLSLSGRWRVADCDEQHYAACRSTSNPLSWRFSSSRGIYTSREDSCPAGTTFAAPRTALENRYLANAFTQFKSSTSASNDLANEPGPWVDFNALDKQSCWVSGAKTTCPYNSGGGTKRQVVIPIVAAVIVLVIAALLLFVKCAANRRNIRRGRKRRGKEDVGEYEGVPS